MTNWRVAEERAAELREHLKRGTVRIATSVSNGTCDVCQRNVPVGQTIGTFPGKAGHTTACGTCMEIHRLVLRTDPRPMN